MLAMGVDGHFCPICRQIRSEYPLKMYSNALTLPVINSFIVIYTHALEDVEMMSKEGFNLRCIEIPAKTSFGRLTVRNTR